MPEIRILSEAYEQYVLYNELRSALHWPNGCDDPSLLLASPHDDDGIISAGLLLQQARAEEIPARVAVVTDGTLGYTSQIQQHDIAQIRIGETYDGYGKLGFGEDQITWLNYPDSRTPHFIGGSSVEGHQGLENSFTHLLRQVRPTHVLTTAASEIHPDHRTVAQEVRVSIQHAASAIWPELGDPLAAMPSLLEFPVGAPLESPPTHLFIGSPEQQEQKLAAIACYKSQRQIERLVESIRQNGAFEFFRIVPTAYDPQIHLARFGLIP